MIPAILQGVTSSITRFASPWFLLAFILIPFLLWFATRKKLSASIRFSSLTNLKGIKKSPRTRAAGRLFIILLIGLSFLIIALARPQTGLTQEKMHSEGVDIVISLDVSSSMKSVDFKPVDRLTAAKKVAHDFISGRENDRIGLVIFSAYAFTQCPLTTDYGMLLNFLDQVNFGQIEDGTAIGLGLATAANRLANSTSKSKVIILLTDGVNNRGEIDPITAARIAQALDLRVYTIGIGRPGGALMPVDDPIFGRRYQKADFDIDEPVLREIARITGGQYFRADDTDKLAAIINEIDEMERTLIEVTKFTKYRELAPVFMTLGLLFVL
jgi:Ca-activated chloride channel family protein